MKKVILNKCFNSLIFVLFAFGMEAISFAFMFHDILADYFYLDLLFFVGLTFPIYFIKSNKIDHIYLSILLIFISFILILNTNFYHVFGDIFSLQYLSMIGNGLEVVSASYINFMHLFLLLACDALFVFLILFKDKKIKLLPVANFQPHGVCFSSLVLILSLGCYLLSLNQVCLYEKNVKNNPTMDLITLAKTANFQKLGMLSYYMKEANTLLDKGKIEDHDFFELQKYFLTYEWKENAYTGLLKDYSIFTIMIETGAQMMVNETLTPNLYKLMQNSINASNNYCKNKTNVSEYIGIVGNYPTAGLNLSNHRYELPFSLPNLLPEKYQTMYFHDVGGSKDIYRREILMPQLGFDNTYLHSDLWPDVPMWNWNGNYPLDSLTVDSVLNFILKDTRQPFYAYWTTLSMHGPYYQSANEWKLKNLYYETLKNAEQTGKWINPLYQETNGNRECMEVYMMAVMDFDVALGKILRALEEKGILDKTLLVLYGDHEVYYDGADGKPLNLVLFNHDNLYYYDIYNTVLLFYNEKLKEKFITLNGTNTIEPFTSPSVIVPTILDLLGILYNPNFYIGDSIFSQAFLDTQVFYSYELSCFFNNQFLSKDGLKISSVFDPLGDEEAFLNTVSGMITKQIHLDTIYKNNIFSKYDLTFQKK